MSKDCLNDEDLISMEPLKKDIVKFEVIEKNGKKNIIVLIEILLLNI